MLYAETSKEAAFYNKKMAADRQDVEKLVAQHNKLTAFGTRMPPIMAAVDTVVRAEFPWADEIRVQTGKMHVLCP